MKISLQYDFHTPQKNIFRNRKYHVGEKNEADITKGFKIYVRKNQYRPPDTILVMV